MSGPFPNLPSRANSNEDMQHPFAPNTNQDGSHPLRHVSNAFEMNYDSSAVLDGGLKTPEAVSSNRFDRQAFASPGDPVAGVSNNNQSYTMHMMNMHGRQGPGPLHFPPQTDFSTGPAALMSPQPGGPQHNIFDPMSPQTGRVNMTPSMPGFSFHPFPQTPPLLPQFLSPGIGPFSPPISLGRFNMAPGAPIHMRALAGPNFHFDLTLAQLKLAALIHLRSPRCSLAATFQTSTTTIPSRMGKPRLRMEIRKTRRPLHKHPRARRLVMLKLKTDASATRAKVQIATSLRWLRNRLCSFAELLPTAQRRLLP
jgi:hypothetical protein